MLSAGCYAQLWIVLTSFTLSLATSLPTEFVEDSSSGSEFYVGILLVQNTPLTTPSILVTTEENESVNFSLRMENPPFVQNATIENGGLLLIPLPLPITENERDIIIGVNVFTETPASSIKVFFASDSNGLFPALPCSSSPIVGQREDRVQYSYHMFPAVLEEQPFTASTLLLVGCQDATFIEIFSTAGLSLPVSVNATVNSSHSLSSGTTYITSFTLNQLETLAIQLTGDISMTRLMSNKPLTVTITSIAECLKPSLTGLSSESCASSYTQLPVSYTWGKRFLVSSRPGRYPRAGYIIQVAIGSSTIISVICGNATHRDTEVFILESQIRLHRLRKPSQHQCSIESLQTPIQVIQYSLQRPRGSDTVFPLLIPPIEQYTKAPGIIPLSPQVWENDTVVPQQGRDFRFFVSIFVPIISSSDDTLARRVLVNGETLPSQLWKVIICRKSMVCGYFANVLLPLQSTVDISHEREDTAMSVLVHRVGAHPHSFSAGYRLNDLTVPIVYFERDSYAVTEDDKFARLTVIRGGGDLTKEAEILFTTEGNSAFGGEDFVEMNGTLTFSSGEKQKVITVSIINDILLEVNETFLVLITPANEGVVVARGNVSVTIKDTDVLEVGFERESYTVSEMTGRLEVNITSPAPLPGPFEVILRMTTFNGTAKAPEDFFPLDLFLVFTPGIQYLTVALHAFEDSIVETELEWFSLSLNVLVIPAGRVIFTQQNTTVFIEDSNTIFLELVPSSVMVTEDDEEGSKVTIVVTSSGETVRPVTVFLVTSDLSTTGGEDYRPVREALTFTTNRTRYSVEIDILGDSVVEEEDEVFAVEIELPEGENGVTLMTSRILISIIDDDSVILMFSMPEITVSEAAGVVDLTIIKSGANSRDISVLFSTLEGNAVDGEDYAPVAGRITYSSEDISARLQVVIRDDDVVEYQERFVVVLTIPDTELGVTLGDPRRVVITIINDDVVEIGFAQEEYSVEEGGGEVVLTITKSGTNDRDLDVTFATEQNSATCPSDFSRKADILVFSSLNLSLEVSVTIAEDSVAERVENFTVLLIPIAEGITLAPGQERATVQIIDNDFVVVGFSQSIYMALEGDMEVAIELTRSGSTNLPITVLYSTQQDTATAGVDYVSLTNTSITFSGTSGETPVIKLNLRDDEMPESTEQFFLRLILPDQLDYDLRLDSSSVSTTIVILDNDDVTVRFEPEMYRVTESSSSVSLQLVLSGETSNRVAVTIHSFDREAIAPGDYSRMMMSVVFEPGEREKSVAIPIIDDRVLEESESFSVELSALSTGVAVSDSSATVIIEDNDVLVAGFETLLVGTSEATGVGVVRVTLNGTTEIPLLLHFSSLNDTAKYEEDYTLVSESLTVSSGETTGSVIVQIVPDLVIEFTERFAVILTSTNNTRLLIDPNRQTATIEIQDTSVARVMFVNESVEVRESEMKVTLGLRVEGKLERPVTVQLSTRDGTATVGEDYVEKDGELIILAGENGGLVEIEPLDDDVVEGEKEYFSVELTTKDTSLSIPTPSANVTILDDDSITVTFSSTMYTVDEGGGSVTLQIMMVEETESLVDLPVLVSTVDGTAISAVGDYIKVEKFLLTFGPTRREQSIEITITDNPALELDESFTTVLSVPPGQEERVKLVNNEATITILDNDEVVLELGQTMYFAIEGEPVVFVTIRKFGISYIDVPFTVSTQSGTATADEDFMSIVPEMAFESSQSIQFVPIMILDDQVVEGDEQFSVRLESLPNLRGVKLRPDPVFITILENDFLVVMFDPVTYTVREGDGEVNLTVLIEGVSIINLSLIIFTDSDNDTTAEADEDYNETIIFSDIRPNQTSITATVPIINDVIREGVEMFNVALLSASEFLLVENSIAVVQILDNNVPLLVVSADVELTVGFDSMKYTVSEEEGSVEVCLVASPAPPSTLTFLIYTEEKTAQGGGVDYMSVAKELEVSPGQTQSCESITIVNDKVMERREDLLVFVQSDPVNELVIEGLSLAPAVADICINDDDSISIGFERDEVTISEGGREVTVKVIKTGSSAIPVNVMFTTGTGGTAEAGVDYDPLRGSLVFSASDAETEIVVSVNEDGFLEETEYFTLVLSLPMSSDELKRVSLTKDTLQINILDNDVVTVGFESGVYTVSESSERLTVCVTKDKITVNPIILRITSRESSPPSATEDQDFRSTATIVTLPGPTTSDTCTELNLIIEDSIHEDSQFFLLGLDIVSTEPFITLGTQDQSVITIVDNDVIHIVGVNRTVSESDGKVEVCLVMDRVAEVPVSLDITFSKDADPNMNSAEGGIDFDNAPRRIVFRAGEIRSCIVVNVFPDQLDEKTEQFTVVVTSSDDRVIPLIDGGFVITITNSEGPVREPLCKALDSIVIEPFPSATAALDSFMFHSPCEHILLTSCTQRFNHPPLRVTISYSPSNFDLLGLAININRTKTIKILRDTRVEMINFTQPFFSNQTHSIYSEGIVIVSRGRSIGVTLAEMGINITRTFGDENVVEIRVFDTDRAGELCGLCGTVDGRLLFNDGTREAVSIDTNGVEEFAHSWRVSPQEVLLGQQGEECGTLRNDTVIGDPLFTVPLNFHSSTQSRLTTGDTPHLCFEVHGERGSIFSLISDQCTSVNALFAAMAPPNTGNIITTVGITAIDYSGNCVKIEASLANQCAPVIHNNNDGTRVSPNRYSLNGVSVRRHQQGVRIAVPNCQNTPLVLWILCDESRNVSMIRFVISRGINLRPTSHGLLGQFWNIPVTVTPMTTSRSRAPLTLNSLPPPYLLTLSPPLSPQRRFIARLYSNTWDKRGKQCYYAGSGQGGPLGELESPILRDSVIQGRYTDYIVDRLFDTHFPYSQFNTRHCTSES